MPSTSSFTNTGALQYTSKQGFVSTTSSITGINPFQSLLSCYIVTDVQDLSFKVISNGVVIGHFINDQIVSWDVQGNSILLKTKDELVYTFSFVSVPECLLGDQRINDNINGLITVGC